MSTSLLRHNSLFNLKTFLVFLSIPSSSLFVHFTKSAPYLIKETAHVLSLLFMINFVLRRYSLRNFSVILLSLILLYSKIPRYLYPFFSTYLVRSPSGIPTPSDDTTFSLFNTNTPQSFIPSAIPESFFNICTVQTNPLFHAHSLKRSLNHP